MSRWPEAYVPLCACAACGRDFTGETAFDAHRLGVHAYAFSAEHLDGRRCAEDEEMPALGLRRFTDEEMLAGRYAGRAGSGVPFYGDPEASARMARATWRAKA